MECKATLTKTSARQTCFHNARIRAPNLSQCEQILSMSELPSHSGLFKEYVCLRTYMYTPTLELNKGYPIGYGCNTVTRGLQNNPVLNYVCLSLAWVSKYAFLYQRIYVAHFLNIAAAG